MPLSSSPNSKCLWVGGWPSLCPFFQTVQPRPSKIPVGKGTNSKCKQKSFMSLHIVLGKDKSYQSKIFRHSRRACILLRHPASVSWKVKIEFSWRSPLPLTKRIVPKVSVTQYFLRGSGIVSMVCAPTRTLGRIRKKVYNPGDCISKWKFCSLTFVKTKGRNFMIWKLETWMWELL